MEANQSKKRVLYFIPEFPRLTETFIEREVSWLIGRGNLDLTVFSLKKASGQTSSEVSAHTVYKNLSLIESVRAVRFFFGRRERVAEAYRLVMKDTSQSVLARFYLFLKSVGYAQMFSHLHPDHIHAHFLSDPSTVAMVASLILGSGFSVSGHARDVFVEGTLIKEKIQNANFISVCNSFAYQRCVEIAGEENSYKVHMIYHGVEAEKISEALHVGKDAQRKPLLLTVARLVEKKGLKYLIEASEILKNQDTDHELRIVGGPGDLYEELKKDIEARGLEGTVFIEGEGKGLPHEQVLDLYRRADVFVLPSVETGAGDVDGVPNVIVESALAKLPIITTNAGGITDLIENEVTGLIVNQRDSQALATQIHKVLHNKEMAKTLGENACNKAKEMFNLEKNVGEMERLFLL